MSNCTKCGGETLVKDSRPKDWDNIIIVRRRRHCPDCRIRFITYELPEGKLDEMGFSPEGKKRSLVKKLRKLLDSYPT